MYEYQTDAEIVHRKHHNRQAREEAIPYIMLQLRIREVEALERLAGIDSSAAQRRVAQMVIRGPLATGIARR